MATQTKVLKIDQVKVEEGFNPRGEVDQTAPEFAELLESVREQGVLQPVLVREPEGGAGPHTLVAGERRFRAAVTAQMSEIPVVVLDSSVDAELAAITENVQREDLSPLQEAQAIARMSERMSVDDVAKTLGKSKDWIRERRRILELSEGARSSVDAGHVPLAAVPNLATIAAVSPSICDAVTSLAIAQERPEALYRNMGDLMRDLERESLPKDATLISVGEGIAGRYRYPSLLKHLGSKKGVTKKAREAIEAAWKEMPKRGEYDYDWDEISFESDDLEAARAYGCLIEFGRKGYPTRAYMTDPAFVADRIPGAIARKIEKVAERKKREEENRRRSRGPTAKDREAKLDVDARKEEREKRARERQKEIDARAASHRANLELGQLCRRKLATAKVTADVAQLMFVMSGKRASGWFERLCYTDDGLHVEEWKVTKKQEAEGLTGTVKVQVLEDAKRAEAWRKELERAKTPGQIAGLYLRLAIAARFVDVGVSLQPDKPPLEGPVGPPGGYYGDFNLTKSQRDRADVNKLVDKIALDLGVLPEDMRAAAAKRAPRKKSAKRASGNRG